ncbi:hypothetical protein ABPG72_017002 [Tetrahymena utriculariae]
MAEPQSKVTQIQVNPTKWVVETQKNVTEVIFPQQSYVWDDLCFKKNSQFTISSELFYTISYDKIQNSRKGTAKKYLDLLYSQLNIEEAQLKPRKVTKKETKLDEKNKKRLLALQLISQGLNDGQVKLQSKINSKELHSVKQLIYQGYSGQIGITDRSTKFTSDVQKWVNCSKRSLDFTFSSADQIKKQAAQELNLPEQFISTSGFRKAMNKKCNVSYKRLSYCKPSMEDDETRSQREHFVIEMVPMLLKDYEPIFIDEAGLMLNQKQMYGWVPKGQKAIVESSSSTNHLTILGAVTRSRVLCYMLVRGWVDQHIFMAFISQIMCHLEQEGSLLNHCFVFDQASCHQSNELKSIFLDQIPCILTPRNSPQLNPIELLWSHLKRKLSERKHALERDLLFHIYSILRETPGHFVSNFFQHSARFYRLALGHKPFSGIFDESSL